MAFKVLGLVPFPPEYERPFMNGALILFGDRCFEAWEESGLAGDFITIMATQAGDLSLPDTLTIWAMLVFAYERPKTLRGEAGWSAWRTAMANALPHPAAGEPRPEELVFVATPDDPVELLRVSWTAGGFASQGVHARQIKRYAREIEGAYDFACRRFASPG